MTTLLALLAFMVAYMIIGAVVVAEISIRTGIGLPEKHETPWVLLLWPVVLLVLMFAWSRHRIRAHRLTEPQRGKAR